MSTGVYTDVTLDVFFDVETFDIILSSIVLNGAF